MRQRFFQLAGDAALLPGFDVGSHLVGHLSGRLALAIPQRFAYHSGRLAAERCS
jgi:hypothetical protein